MCRFSYAGEKFTYFFTFLTNILCRRGSVINLLFLGVPSKEDQIWQRRTDEAGGW